MKLSRPKVKYWCELRKTTQRALCAKLGIVHERLHRATAGMAHMSTEDIERIAAALECSPSDLLEGSGNALPK